MTQSSGVSDYEVRRIVNSEISRIENKFNRRINDLMSDITRIGNKLEGAIERQTAAIIAGVGATTSAVVSTKEDLGEKLLLQVRSSLQLELGRKLNDARSSGSSMAAFFGDIKERFDKSIESIYLNRLEYDERFKQIYEEYQNKIRTIGEHIFQIRDEIKLVENNSSESLEQLYSLPIEVDLHRLELRSSELNDTVDMLAGSRLQEIKNSLTDFEKEIDALSFGESLPNEFALETSYVESEIAKKSFIAANLKYDDSNLIIENNDTDNQNIFKSKASEIINSEFNSKSKRNLEDEEYNNLIAAANTLLEDELISKDDYEFALSIIQSRKITKFN